MIRGKNILLLMDSHLEGNFSTEEATVVFDLASRCLQYEPRERPNRKDLVATLAPLQNKSDVSCLSYSFHPFSEVPQFPSRDVCMQGNIVCICSSVLMKERIWILPDSEDLESSFAGSILCNVGNSQT